MRYSGAWHSANEMLQGEAVRKEAMNGSSLSEPVAHAPLNCVRGRANGSGNTEPAARISKSVPAEHSAKPRLRRGPHRPGCKSFITTVSRRAGNRRFGPESKPRGLRF